MEVGVDVTLVSTFGTVTLSRERLVSPISKEAGVFCDNQWTCTMCEPQLFRQSCRELTVDYRQVGCQIIRDDLSGEIPSDSKDLEEGDIQTIHTSPPERLADEELLLNTICVDDLQRKCSVANKERK